jgi:formate-dependent nitrite reductase cytochrome c552 subunit
MPYTKVGAMKVSDHHVRSPLLNINRACQTCHRWSEEELKGRAETITNAAQKQLATARSRLQQATSAEAACKTQLEQVRAR